MIARSQIQLLFHQNHILSLQLLKQLILGLLTTQIFILPAQLKITLHLIILMTLIRNNTSKKNNNHSTIQNHQYTQEVSPFAINDLQNTIDPHNFLTNRNACRCSLCLQQKTNIIQAEDGNLFKAVSKASSHWLKRLLDALCLSGAKTLKLNIPDILFVEKESLQTFQASRKDGRLIKLSGTTPLKSLFATMVRLRKQYKYMLQLNFNKKMVQTIEPQFMHVAYFQRFVPSYFHDGMSNIKKVQENKFQFKRYILHKNQNFEIQQIEEHKMNEKQPFCIVKYMDGNCQLFNQIQFEVFALQPTNKLQADIVFVQSYIKYKLEAEAIYYSLYTLNKQSIGSAVDRRAEKEVLVLIGGISKYEQGYIDIQTIQQLGEQLMLKNPRQYVQLMTYKIIHYLNMTSRIYIQHIKIKWIMNDLGNIYLQEIMELQISEVPRRHVKYRLPPKDHAIQSITNDNNFHLLYQNMKNRKHYNTNAIRKRLAQQPNYRLQAMQIQPQKIQQPSQLYQYRSRRSSQRYIVGKQGQKNRKDQEIKSNNKSNNVKSIEKRLQLAQARSSGKQIKLGFHNSPEHKWEKRCQSQQKQRASQRINKYFTITHGECQKRRNSAAQTHKNSSMRYIQQINSDKRVGSTRSTWRGQRCCVSIQCIE